MNTHTRRILIVDDDPLQVGLLRRQIQRTGIAASVEGHTVAAAALASRAAAAAPVTRVIAPRLPCSPTTPAPIRSALASACAVRACRR